MPICAVWFDVGETLIDESREYGTWADWLGVPRHSFSAVFGAVIARGKDYREVFQHFRPGFDLDKERQARLDAGLGEYCAGPLLRRPTVPTRTPRRRLLRRHRREPDPAGRDLHPRADLPADLIATSDDWGVSKPSEAFFDKLIAVSGHRPEEIAYVGDRLDNDIAPAVRRGINEVWVRRGPWGFVLEPGGAAPTRFDDAPPALTVDDVATLPDRLASL